MGHAICRKHTGMLKYISLFHNRPNTYLCFLCIMFKMQNNLSYMTNKWHEDGYDDGYRMSMLPMSYHVIHVSFSSVILGLPLKHLWSYYMQKWWSTWAGSLISCLNLCQNNLWPALSFGHFRYSFLHRRWRKDNVILLLGISLSKTKIITSRFSSSSSILAISNSWWHQLLSTKFGDKMMMVLRLSQRAQGWGSTLNQRWFNVEPQPSSTLKNGLICKLTSTLIQRWINVEDQLHFNLLSTRFKPFFNHFSTFFIVEMWLKIQLYLNFI